MWNIVESRQLDIRFQRHRVIIRLLDQLDGSFAFQAAIPMMCVMEALKTLALSLNGCKGWEPLCLKNLPVVRVVEALDDGVVKVLQGNKDRRNVEEKA